MKPKEIYRRTLIEYLGDWENPIPNRLEMAKVCKVKPDTLRKHFTPDEYAEIEKEGLELRKKRSAKPRMQVYQSMLKGAKGGVVPAQKEFLDRTEGKVIDRLQVGIDEATLSTILTTLPPEQAEKTKAALLAITTHKTKP